jgi:ABC-2 type transport system permease protein
MTLAVFLQTLEDKARGNILAILLILVFVTYMVMMFPEIRKMTGLDEVMKNPAFQAILGKNVDFASFDGFMSLEAFSLSAVVICGYLGFISASFLAGEIEMKTIDTCCWPSP